MDGCDLELRVQVSTCSYLCCQLRPRVNRKAFSGDGRFSILLGRCQARGRNDKKARVDLRDDKKINSDSKQDKIL